MFTSLSANVGFNPLLAGVLARGRSGKSLPAAEARLVAGANLRRQGHPPPSVAWLTADESGCSRGHLLETLISIVKMSWLFPKWLAMPVCAPLPCSLPTQQKKHWSCP